MQFGPQFKSTPVAAQAGLGALSLKLKRSFNLKLCASFFAAALGFSALDAQANDGGSVQLEPANSTISNELAGTTLRVAFSVVSPFVDLQSRLTEPSGLDADIIKELQRRTGFKIQNNKADLMNFKELIEQGAKGNIDIVAGAVTINEERMRLFDATKPYIKNSLCLVARKNDTIKTINDLNGRTLSIIQGADISGFTRGGRINLRTYGVASPFMSFFAVARNHADAVITDEILATEYITLWKDTELEIKSIIPNTESSIGLMFRKGNPANAALMKAYDEMLADGTMERLLNEHLSNFIFSHKNMDDKHAQLHMESETLTANLN